MVSGYYAFNTDRRKVAEKILQKLIHIGKMAILACAFYFVWQLFLLHNAGKIKEWLESLVTFESIRNFLCFNDVLYRAPLWFLFALLYSYGLYFFVNKFNLNKLAYMTIPILLLVNLLFGEMHTQILGKDVPLIYTRNFAFCGFPFFMLGNLIHKNKEKLQKVSRSKAAVLGVAVLGLCLSAVEQSFFGLNDLFIGTIIAVAVIFLFAVVFPEAVGDNFIAKIGYKYSLLIYLIHPMVIDCMRKAINILNLFDQSATGYINPILVCLVTTLFAVSFFRVQGRIMKK